MKGRISDNLADILRDTKGREQLRFLLQNRKEGVIKTEEGVFYKISFTGKIKK